MSDDFWAIPNERRTKTADNLEYPVLTPPDDLMAVMGTIGGGAGWCDAMRFWNRSGILDLKRRCTRAASSWATG
jgi:hypothetical protein